LITSPPPTLTVSGLMSPVASTAVCAWNAHGTDVSGVRGVISGSAPTVMPRYRGVAPNTSVSIVVIMPSVVA
jgi:hypothetical protein